MNGLNFRLIKQILEIFSNEIKRTPQAILLICINQKWLALYLDTFHLINHGTKSNDE